MSVNIRENGSLVRAAGVIPSSFATINTGHFKMDPLNRELNLSDEVVEKLDELDNADTDAGKVLTANGDGTADWKVAKGGHDMWKTISDPDIPKDEEGDIKIPSDDEHVLSAHAVFEVANTKTYIISVEAKIDDGNNNGIGTWCEDVDNYDPSVDSVDWIGARADHPEDADISEFLKTLDNNNNVSIVPIFEADRNEPVYCGGYQIDTTNGRFCMKFGYPITKDALVGFEIKVVTNVN